MTPTPEVGAAPRAEAALTDIAASWMPGSGSALLPRPRNLLAAEFLATAATHALWTDSNIF